MKSIGLIIILVMIFALSGCATYKVQNVRMESIESYVNKTSQGNITVAADPFDTADKAKSAFYVDLTSKNIRPINLIIDNKSDSEILLLRSEVKINDSSGNIFQPIKSDYVFSKFEKSEFAYAFFGFGIFSYMSAEDANKKMKDDWFKKEMPEEKIIPVDRVQSGFIFFEIPQHVSGCNVTVPVKILKTGEKLEFKVSIR